MIAEDRPKPRKRPLWFRLILIFVGMVCMLILGYVIFRTSLKHRIAKRLDAIRAEGYPVTLAELDAWYPDVPSGQNAAKLYRAIQAEVTASARQQARWDPGSRIEDPIYRMIHWKSVRGYTWRARTAIPTLSDPLSTEMLEGITKFVEHKSEIIERLHQAAAMKECRYPIRLTTGPGLALPHLYGLPRATEWLQAEAIMFTKQGDSAKAVQSVMASLAIGRSLKNEPLLASQLKRMVVDSVACCTLERVLSRIALSDEQLIRLATALADEEDINALTRAMVGERCAGLFLIEKRASFALVAEDGNRRKEMTGKSHLRRGRRDLDLIAYLDIMNRTIERSERPLSERFGTNDSAIKKSIADLPDYCIMTKTLTPALGRAFQQQGEIIATLRCAKLAVAIERYRLAHGTLPEDLDVLVPQFVDSMPLDPFDGKPLRFKKQEKGYVVYSIGTNQTDDGGSASKAEDFSEYSGQPLDILFTVER